MQLEKRFMAGLPIPETEVLIVDTEGNDVPRGGSIRGGENISSLELKNVLLTHPSVARAAVIPMPDENGARAPRRRSC